jgi:hypothetical protein
MEILEITMNKNVIESDYKNSNGKRNERNERNDPHMIEIKQMISKWPDWKKNILR